MVTYLLAFSYSQKMSTLDSVRHSIDYLISETDLPPKPYYVVRQKKLRKTKKEAQQDWIDYRVRASREYREYHDKINQCVGNTPLEHQTTCDWVRKPEISPEVQKIKQAKKTREEQEQAEFAQIYEQNCELARKRYQAFNCQEVPDVQKVDTPYLDALKKGKK